MGSEMCIRDRDYIGGKDNIGAVSHCATRMRFVLKDTKIADENKIKKIKSVKGTFTQAGQFQVIIGNDVPTFYNEFTEIAGIDGVSKDSVKNAAKSNMNLAQRLMSNIAEIFAPLIPALIIGGLILGFIWQFIFVNVFNAVGQSLGQEWMMGWLSNSTTGFWGMVIIMAWQMAGYVMVIYIAGLQNVPPELNEAAKIDGANAWQRIKLITFPMIRPSFTISLFLTLSNSFKLFDQNLALTNGGPGNATQMLALNIYQTAFSYNKMNLAQAKAVIFFVFVCIITLVQVYMTKKDEVEA